MKRQPRPSNQRSHSEFSKNLGVRMALADVFDEKIGGVVTRHVHRPRRTRGDVAIAAARLEPALQNVGRRGHMDHKDLGELRPRRRNDGARNIERQRIASLKTARGGLRDAVAMAVRPPRQREFATACAASKASGVRLSRSSELSASRATVRRPNTMRARAKPRRGDGNQRVLASARRPDRQHKAS